MSDDSVPSESGPAPTWRWSSRSAGDLLEPLLRVVPNGSVVQLGFKEQESAVRVSLAGGVELLVFATGPRAWVEGPWLSVSHQAELGPDRDSLHAIATSLAGLDEDAASLIRESTEWLRAVHDQGAMRGESLPLKHFGPDAELLTPFFEMFRLVYGSPVGLRHVPDARIEAVALDFPRLGDIEEGASFLGRVDSISPGIREHLACLGYGWSPDGAIRVIPSPRVFEELVAAVPVVQGGYRPELLRRDSFELPGEEWATLVAEGRFPVVIPKTVSRPTAALCRFFGGLSRMGLPIPAIVGSRTAALLHDMGIHVAALHLVPAAVVDEVRARVRQDVSTGKRGVEAGRRWAHFLENDFTQLAWDVLATVEDVRDFGSAFEQKVEPLLGHVT